ncbi:type II toxin-antitoxin system VapC family toxin [Prosthecobacter sp.]|uniref:type II toxin-antitoxin system VapC family toxin n=1 Tax=Prosthecobacter sp. TaxID=1965333 RepID=UPI0037837463
MSGTKKPIIYWDAAVYIAWLLEEEAYAPFLPVLKAIADANLRGENIMVTSTITLIEVTPKKLDNPALERKFQRCFDGHRHKLIEVGPPVAMRARDYRQDCSEAGRQLLTPDAIHLATATIERVDEFHTFDRGRKKGIDDDLNKTKTVSLIGLNGSDKVHKLKIINPDYPQGMPTLL